MDNRDAHMILMLDLLQYDCHEKLAKQVVQEYGKVRSSMLQLIY